MHGTSFCIQAHIFFRMKEKSWMNILHVNTERPSSGDPKCWNQCFGMPNGSELRGFLMSHDGMLQDQSEKWKLYG